MIERSKISYCDYSSGDANVINGCTPASAGCTNCYSRVIYERFGRDFSQVKEHPDKLKRLARAKFTEGDIPYRRGKGSRPIVFIGDMGDLFHPGVSEGFILDVLDVLESRTDVNWIVLTKRAQRMMDITIEWGKKYQHFLSDHIWMGVTVESPQYLGRLVYLHKAYVTTRWMSYEPALAPLPPSSIRGLSWVVAGAESGSKRRPFDASWARTIYKACVSDGIAFFGKQNSGLHPGTPLLIDGKAIQEFPIRR